MLFHPEIRPAAAKRFESVFPELSADVMEPVMLYASGINVKLMKNFDAKLGERSATNKLKKATRLLELNNFAELRLVTLIRLNLKPF